MWVSKSLNTNAATCQRAKWASGRSLPVSLISSTRISSQFSDNPFQPAKHASSSDFKTSAECSRQSKSKLRGGHPEHHLALVVATQEMWRADQGFVWTQPPWRKRIPCTIAQKKLAYDLRPKFLGKLFKNAKKKCHKKVEGKIDHFWGGSRSPPLWVGLKPLGRDHPCGQGGGHHPHLKQ